MRRCEHCGSHFWPAKPFHKLCSAACYQAVHGEPQHQQRAPELHLDEQTLREAVALCHPDRHPESRQEQATRVTQALLGALEATRRIAA